MIGEVKEFPVCVESFIVACFFEIFNFLPEKLRPEGQDRCPGVGRPADAGIEDHVFALFDELLIFYHLPFRINETGHFIGQQ